jgi:hypothetical protein
MNPYENLPLESFWRTAVANLEPSQIEKIWKPKFSINKKQKIITLGSCFAQHISKALIAEGYSWLDGEPAPRGLTASSQELFNYGIFSFRTGNIYTAALLKQWIKWSISDKTIPEEVWIKDNRFYDPFRPNIEPNGFSSFEEMLASRNDTLTAIQHSFKKASLFVFTLGLTEGWINKQHKHVYPMCPGTIAGDFDADKHEFINYSYTEIRKELRECFNLIKTINPNIRFLLTVSPVPLTATATNKHVLVATTYSKSTLVAVAHDMANSRPDTDYFPSYELITSFPFKAMYYQKNLRSVTNEGVNFVMGNFFSCLGHKTAKNNITNINNDPQLPVESIEENNDVVCEEELLAAFGNTGKEI